MNGDEQLDLYPAQPIIARLAVNKMQIKGGFVTGSLEGMTNVPDVAALTRETWKLAVAGWLLMLCGNRDGEALQCVVQAFDALEAMPDKDSNVVGFGER